MAQSAREIYWSAIVADFRQSGLTHVQFCQLRRISLASFRQWLYRLRPGLSRRTRRNDASTPPPTPTQTPDFLPVHVRPAPLTVSKDRQPASAPSSLELILNEQYRLRVPVGFDPATLHQLLDILRERS